MNKFTNKIEEENFKKKIIDFISQVVYSELITAKDNVPHIRPMVYVNNGLTIYMATRRDTPKVEQIKANPNVSVMIIKSFQEAAHSQEVIIEGLAVLVENENERNWVFEAFKNKPKTFQEWLEVSSTDEYEVIKITPHVVKYFNYAEGESMPQIINLSA